ncbi:DNA repair protein RadA/Sms [Candidatus Caldarchaeum subterraneum]|uniref:DNA repair protein RadA/Sms n=1 Tax=Caldiarchaeum subterraneum TaxID=311458 RepID=E6N6M7_CALS0|nr:DNA repair protein RadA/Sms [Candidatus Caldarchaeum subterraneum]BAJ50772.1 DNA repair protein RadA/Sms [Candidatus Caldarchaeum subterraneum]
MYLTSEQSPSDLKSIIQRLYNEGISEPLSENLLIEPLPDLRELEIWSRIILGEKRVAEYSGIKLVVIDSVQAGGVSPAARKMYTRVNKFTTALKNRKITTFLTSHVTKKGDIAGPKDLEHHVDCVLQFRRAFKLRPLFVPKNRFGPAKLDPFVLEIGNNGLYPSRHAEGIVGKANGISFATGAFAEIQARVEIPKWGEHGGVRAPYLPRQRIEQLIDTIRNIPNIDVSNLTYNIDCLMRSSPHKQYDHGFDLAVVIALLSSYVQKGINEGCCFYGEVDLQGAVRSASAFKEAAHLKEILEIDEEEDDEAVQLRGFYPVPNILSDTLTTELKKFDTLYVPEEIAKDMASLLDLFGFDVKCKGVSSVYNLIQELWPEIL